MIVKSPHRRVCRRRLPDRGRPADRPSRGRRRLARLARPHRAGASATRRTCPSSGATRRTSSGRCRWPTRATRRRSSGATRSSSPRPTRAAPSAACSASPAPTASCSGRRTSTYAEKERNWNPTWYANASPATDGERVVVSFGSAGMYCYDFAGKELWKRTDLGKWEHTFGNSASPVLYGDLAILWCGPNEARAATTSSR